MSRTRRSRRARVLAESLEPRALMAVFSVNSFADTLSPPAGTVTLRSAIQAANTSPGADTIVLPTAGTYAITTTGTATDNSAGELAIADAGNLTIQNTSGGVVTIRGNGLNRVFDVDPAGSVVPFTVTFAGLTISGGFGQVKNGGGIDAHAAASVVLSGSVVSGNAATGFGGGVAMDLGSTGTLTLLASLVSNDQAQQGGGGVAGLGSGAVTVGAGTILAGNVATDPDGGGGVLVKGPALAVLGAVIRNNRALFIATTSTAPGGGIADGGSGPVTIAGSLIEDNSATGNGGGYDDTGLASLTVRDSFFLGNSAALNGGGIAAGGPQISLTGTVLGGNAALNFNLTNGGGGGLYVTGAGTTRVTDGTILNNTAVQYGGGIEDDGAAHLIVTGTTFSGNVVFQNWGGGIESNTTGDASISNSLFRGNVSGFLGGGLLAQGGGVINIAASRFTGNAAEIGGGADLVGPFLVAGSTFDANRTSGGGGGLEISVPAATSSGLTNSTFVANSAGGSGIEIFGSATGSLAMVDDTVAGNQGGGVKQTIGTLTVRGTILAGNVKAGAPADYTYFGGTLTDQGNNLLSSTTGTSGKFGPSTIIGDPKLGPLVDNGGPRAGAPSTSAVVPTEALLPGSPAFTTGAAGAGLPTTDERGFGRPAQPAIGAYQPQYAANAAPNTVFTEVLYETLLDRVADPAGLSGGVSFLNKGGTPTGLAQILESTPDYLDAEASLLYLRYLDRPTSPSETAGVAAALKGGVTPEQVGEALISSSEFANDYGGANTDTFVEAAFVAVLGRTTSGDPERFAWRAALANGSSRSAVATALLTTTESLIDMTTADFEAALGRDPSTTDLAAFLGAARAGVTSPNRRAIVLGSSFGPRT